MANELKTINLPGIGRYEISGSGGASSFSELTDTDFTNLQNGQVPVYNSTTEKWENGNGGSSLPAGGTQGQVLTKASATDYDVNWTTPSSGGVGKDLTGQSVKPTSSSTVNAGTNAEIFNDYRDRTFNPLSLKASAGNVSSGNYSHSEGKRTTASGDNSHAEGDGSTASGESSHAEGFSTASGDYSHAEGESTASNYYAHAEGMSTTASGMRSHAEGESTTASGTRSHAEGYNTTARYEFQHVQGKYNNNKSTTLFEIGNGTADNARSNAFEVYQDGSLSQDNGSTKFKFTQVNGSDGYYDASGTFHTFSGGIASSVSYDNTTSGLTATNVQSAVDEIVDTIGDISSLPTGGTQGQVLTKNSSTDGDASWATPAAGGVGKDLTGQTIKPTSDTTVTAGTNAEIFNDYRTRTFYNDASVSAGNVASGDYSHAEGERTTASGSDSHAEGSKTIASGSSSHAEGYNTTASGVYAHAEGGNTTVSGNYSHAEGDTTIASGYGAHAEGAYTTASANYSHAEGSSTTAGYANQHVQGKYNNNKSTTLFEIGNGEPGDVSNAFEVYNDGSFSQDDGSTKFRFTNDGTNDGYYDASGTFHTFGSGGVGKDLTGQTVKPTSSSTITAGTNAEIFNDYRDRTFSGTSITAGNVASGMYSHAEGSKTTASNGSSHAEGEGTKASGGCSHAEGSYTTASGGYSHAEGTGTTASGSYSHAEGEGTKASGDNSHVEGYYTTANRLNHSQGHFNKTMSAGAASSTTGDAMAIGNGTSQIALSNCFRVTYTGAVYGLSSYNSSGADYAEFFEWKDGNTESEDRVGYFVTTDGNKIKIANENDYILGIVSGHPSIVGNGDEDWLGRWMRDDFGRFLYDDVEVEDPETHEKTTSKTIRPNPEYDSTKEYVERKDRQEWDYVGMLGALAVRDDGTCEVNGFCKCAEGGIATKADAGYRVIQRISENVIKVIFR